MPRRRHYPVMPVASFNPIATINTTPLIDLMLVLIIMFIVTIPMSTHKVPLDLPSQRPGVPVPVHRLTIAPSGSLAWDGRPIADAELPPRLAGLVADPATPDLHLEADAETRYERVDQVLAQLKRAGVTRLGFIGNAAFVAGLDA